jgi:hypothetical protein
MSVGDREPEIDAGRGKWFIRLRGALPVWAAIILAVIFGGGAALVRAYDKSALEHKLITARIDSIDGRIAMQSCLATIGQTEAPRMREELTRVAQVNGDVYQTIRLRWCPWLPTAEAGKEVVR